MTSPTQGHGPGTPADGPLTRPAVRVRGVQRRQRGARDRVVCRARSASRSFRPKVPSLPRSPTWCLAGAFSRRTARVEALAAMKPALPASPVAVLLVQPEPGGPAVVAMLGALHVSSPSSVLALMLTAALVPGVALSVCCSAPAAANSPSSNAVGWAGGYFPAGDQPPRRPLDGAAQAPPPAQKWRADN